MTDAEIIKKVKIGLFGSDSGNWRDDMLQEYINEVKSFMRGAGVSDTMLTSEEAVGCIMIGVNDLWNYSSGGVKLSEYFKQRVIQLSGKSGGDTV